MSKKAVIFDMDGLMIDSERVTFEGYVDLCAKEGKTLTKDIYIQCLGKPHAGIHQVFYDHFGNDFPIPRIMKENQALMAQRFEKEGVPVKEGLVCLLKYLKEKGYKTIVATSSIRSRVDKILQLANITEYFDDSICGDEVEHGKPAPDIFLNACEKLGVQPEEALVLEDSEMGIEAAHRAGIDVICIPDMKYPEKQYEEKCAAIYKDLNAVKDWLEKN